MTPQEFFKKDLFAEQTGVELLEVREGYSKACLAITENHLNAGRRTQGGAIFTLADLALAAAANSHGALAFSLSSNITFLRASGPGDTLYAEARERYIGRTTGYYQIDITNQDGKLIAMHGPEPGSRVAVRTSNKSGRYFNVGSGTTGVALSLPPAYPTQIGSKSNAKLQ